MLPLSLAGEYQCDGCVAETAGNVYTVVYKITPLQEIPRKSKQVSS